VWILLVVLSLPIILAILGTCKSLYREIYTSYFLLVAYISILSLLACIIIQHTIIWVDNKAEILAHYVADKLPSSFLHGKNIHQVIDFGVGLFFVFLISNCINLFIHCVFRKNIKWIIAAIIAYFIILIYGVFLKKISKNANHEILATKYFCKIEKKMNNIRRVIYANYYLKRTVQFIMQICSFRTYIYLVCMYSMIYLSIAAAKDDDSLKFVCLATTIMIIGALCWTYFRAHRGEKLRLRIILMRLIIVPVTVISGFAMLADQSKEIIAAYIAFVIGAYLSIDSVITAIMDDKEQFDASKK